MKKTAIVAVVILAPSVVFAQLVPTLEREYRVCPDRPVQPEWMENFDIRDSEKVILVQQMYRAQSLRAVAESGDCSCATRFPAWDDVEAYYFEHYATLEHFEILERTSDYSRTANDYRREAMPICKEQGNW